MNFSLHQDGGFSNLNATGGGLSLKRFLRLSINLDVLPTPSPVPFNRSRRETANGALKSIIGVDFRKRIFPRCIARYAANTTTPAPLPKVNMGLSLTFNGVSPSMNLHPPVLVENSSLRGRNPRILEGSSPRISSWSLPVPE